MQGGPESLDRRNFLKGAASLAVAMTVNPDAIESWISTTERPVIEKDDSFASVANSYIANSPKEADAVARKIMRNPWSSASNICGPLATSILLGWRLNMDGTISNEQSNKTNQKRMEGVIPPEMWLGSPTNDPGRYRIAFPPDKYDMFHSTVSIGSQDFNNLEKIGYLKSGDFLYLDGGSFTHYIAISRIDEKGRVYCVSNVHGEKEGEYLIKELMLWDPNSKEGFFRNWAKGVGPERARTGTRGFYLWRRRQRIEDIVDDVPAKSCRDKLTNMMLEQDKGEWNIHIHEIGKGTVFEWRNGSPYHSDSTTKVPLGIVTMKVIKDLYKDEIESDGMEAVLKSKGIEGRTFDQLFTKMLVDSEETATESLARFCAVNTSIGREFQTLGMVASSYEPRRTTQRDMYNLWGNLFSAKLLDRVSTVYLLQKLEQYTPNDDLLLGEIRKRFPGSRQWNKRGINVKEFLTVQDGGVLEVPSAGGSRYFIIGYSGFSKRGKEISYEQMLSFLSKISATVIEYINNTQGVNRSIRKNRSMK